MRGARVHICIFIIKYTRNDIHSFSVLQTFVLARDFFFFFAAAVAVPNDEPKRRQKRIEKKWQRATRLGAHNSLAKSGCRANNIVIRAIMDISDEARAVRSVVLGASRGKRETQQIVTARQNRLTNAQFRRTVIVSVRHGVRGMRRSHTLWHFMRRSA